MSVKRLFNGLHKLFNWKGVAIVLLIISLLASVSQISEWLGIAKSISFSLIVMLILTICVIAYTIGHKR
jgi:hypothetical protein